MVSIRLISLVSVVAAVVGAAPLLGTDTNTNATESVDRDLRRGELMVFGDDGRSQIITEATWNLLLKSMDILPEPPAVDEEWLKAGDAFEEVAFNSTLDKRDCNNYQITIDRTQRFVDWDVQMSPVVIGAGRNGIDVTISKSYSVANAVTVSAGLDISAIKSRLGGSLGINYSRTWTTAQGYLIRGTVDNGETGVVITRPWANRRYGRTFQGCVGSLKQTGTYMATSYEQGAYEGVTWVSGAITACIKKQSWIPLSLCNGSGNFR